MLCRYTFGGIFIINIDQWFIFICIVAILRTNALMWITRYVFLSLPFHTCTHKHSGVTTAHLNTNKNKAKQDIAVIKVGFMNRRGVDIHKHTHIHTHTHTHTHTRCIEDGHY